MNALTALKRAGSVIIDKTHGEDCTLHTLPTVNFRGVRRTRYRQVPDIGPVAEVTIVCRRDQFVSVPRSGLDLTIGGNRWRVATVQPGEMSSDIEIILEGEMR